MQKIIVVVDMQNDFINGSLGTPEAQAILPKVAEMIKNEGENTDFVFTKDTHYEDYLSTPEGKKLPVKHCMKYTEGWQIPECLVEDFGGSPVIIEKTTFGSIDLMEMLDMMIENIDDVEIVFCGLCTDICVVSNALMAKNWFPEAKIVVDSSLCAGVTPASHEAALTTMKMCQIDVI